MRHRSAGTRLNRTSSHRKAMFRNMVTSLFKHERIRTTDAKAKEIRRWADKLVTLAKRGDLHARRQALSIIREKDVVHKLFSEAPERFATVSGGYTRVVKLGFRPGDAAPISMVELVTPEVKKKKARRKKKSTKTDTSSASATAAVAPEDSAAPETASAAEAAPAEETAAPGAKDEINDPATVTEGTGPAKTETQAAESKGVQTAAEEAPESEAPVSADDATTDETPSKGP